MWISGAAGLVGAIAGAISATAFLVVSEPHRTATLRVGLITAIIVCLGEIAWAFLKQDVAVVPAIVVAGALVGYYTIALADQACGLPLVWTIQDAALDEARALVSLLSTLYRLWPDCPAKLIAGDSAWDEDAWCRLCEVDYGIHPIFRLHPNQKSGGIKGLQASGSSTA